MGERRLGLWKGPEGLSHLASHCPPGPPGLLPQHRANTTSPGLSESLAAGGTGNSFSRGLPPPHLLAGHPGAQPKPLSPSARPGPAREAPGGRRVHLPEPSTLSAGGCPGHTLEQLQGRWALGVEHLPGLSEGVWCTPGMGDVLGDKGLQAGGPSALI